MFWWLLFILLTPAQAQAQAQSQAQAQALTHTHAQQQFVIVACILVLLVVIYLVDIVIDTNVVELLACVIIGFVRFVLAFSLCLSVMFSFFYYY